MNIPNPKNSAVRIRKINYIITRDGKTLPMRKWRVKWTETRNGRPTRLNEEFKTRDEANTFALTKENKS